MPWKFISPLRTAASSAATAIPNCGCAHPKATLADLYDPNTMPPNLRAAHNELDKAVDRCYRKQPFTSEWERVEFLFELYQKLAAPLSAEAKPAKKSRKKRVAETGEAGD
jgi:hypothetical protein